jgi:hypothetical protein
LLWAAAGGGFFLKNNRFACNGIKKAGYVDMSPALEFLA